MSYTTQGFNRKIMTCLFDFQQHYSPFYLELTIGKFYNNGKNSIEK
jgi:hypothetical protein